MSYTIYIDPFASTWNECLPSKFDLCEEHQWDYDGFSWYIVMMLVMDDYHDNCTAYQSLNYDRTLYEATHQ